MKIILVEDDLGIGYVLTKMLKASYRNITWLKSAEELYKLDDIAMYDIVILDVMLPGDNGFKALEWLREEYKNIGVIMLTSKSEVDSKIYGLKLGADDYVSKPFNSKELMARIDALYRKVSLINAAEVKGMDFSAYGLDYDNGTILWKGKEISLTQTEADIIASLVKNKDKIVTRDDLLDMVWGENYYGTQKVVDVNVQRIRKKVSDEIILTKWGRGYQWNG